MNYIRLTISYETALETDLLVVTHPSAALVIALPVVTLMAVFVLALVLAAPVVAIVTVFVLALVLAVPLVEQVSYGCIFHLIASNYCQLKYSSPTVEVHTSAWSDSCPCCF
jgi:hypothetical protein